MKHVRAFQRKINFVKPLYRRVYNNKVLPRKDSRIKVSALRHLDGLDESDKHSNINEPTNKQFRTKQCKEVISKFHRQLVKKSWKNNDKPWNLEEFKRGRLDLDFKHKSRKDRKNMLGLVNMNTNNDENRDNVNKAPDSWLRVYPAPIVPGESICSIIFRCILCQLGLAFILVVWTMGWMVAINHFEGPYEKQVSLDFQNQQHQLVIDLATQLRQVWWVNFGGFGGILSATRIERAPPNLKRTISYAVIFLIYKMTPISPKWRKIIKERIEEERQLTIEAVGNGARLRPGHFWDLSGTFLFTVYVMTALGFGAPVPHTIGGRTSTLVYAIVAVPTQIYLMVNASTCIVIHVEDCIKRVLRSVNETGVFKFPEENYRDHGSRDTEDQNTCRRKFSVVLSVICIGRCMPLTIFSYYVFGVLIFGLARNKVASEMVMFPLEFTTTGGLEQVESHVRVLYGLYVEGAMMLLACALDAVRRHSGTAVSCMSRKYRLFDSEPSSANGATDCE